MSRTESASRPALRAMFAVLRVAAAGLLLWLAWHQAEDWPKLWRRETLHLPWMLVALLAGGVALTGWAVRWWFLLRIVGLPTRFSDAFWHTLCADFFNYYFLGPLGADGYRILAIGRLHASGHPPALASILLDHVVGLLGTAVAFALLTVPRWPQLTAAGGAGAAAVQAAGVALLVILLLTLPGFLVASKIGARIGGHRLPVPKAGRWMAEQLALLADHPKTALAALAASFVSSLSLYGAFAAAACAIEAPLRPMDTLALMPAVESLSSIPFTISGLGLRENLLVDLMGRCYGTPGETALAVSLFGFAAVGAWGALGGVALLCSRWKRKSAASSPEPAQAGPPHPGT